ncbi:hypothetical protein VNO77_33008 [Canavalia gladiata]|uniref:Uncharacterized protein n=1 Tax=Canavalia gladiata TaxID=3824 RepID=A0AAN9KD24_CANGL
MASQSQSQAQANKLTVSTSPKSDSGSGSADGGAGSLPKGHCLCSPTTHEGSFRCRLHRGPASAPTWMKRSKSMPTNKPVLSLSPDSTSS